MRVLGQFARYGTVGLISNVLLYGAYLGLTALGVTPKVAMTVLYAIGVTFTFVFNRAWTFRYRRNDPRSFARYVATYALGFVFNLAGLIVAVDMWGWPHRPVQGVFVLMTALLIFTLLKLWVFPHGRPMDVAPMES